MQIHNRMLCARRNKQNMRPHTIHIHSQQIVKNAWVYACFAKNTAEKRSEWGHERKKHHSIVASGYLSFISTSQHNNTQHTIASTHIINPIQWHFTGERLLHRCSYSITSPHLTSLSLHSNDWISLILFLSSQKVCKIYPHIQWEIHFRNKNKTQNIINFITRSVKESYRFDPAVMQTVLFEHLKNTFSPFSFTNGH